MTKHWRKFHGAKLAQSGTKSEAVQARFVHVEVRQIVSAIGHRRIFETLARLRHPTPERLLVHALRASSIADVRDGGRTHDKRIETPRRANEAG
jgi:hypothetical protein